MLWLWENAVCSRVSQLSDTNPCISIWENQWHDQIFWNPAGHIDKTYLIFALKITVQWEYMQHSQFLLLLYIQISLLFWKTITSQIKNHIKEENVLFTDFSLALSCYFISLGYHCRSDHNNGQQNRCLIFCPMTALIPNFTGYPMFTNEFKC